MRFGCSGRGDNALQPRCPISDEIRIEKQFLGNPKEGGALTCEHGVEYRLGTPVKGASVILIFFLPFPPQVAAKSSLQIMQLRVLF